MRSISIFAFSVVTTFTFANQLQAATVFEANLDSSQVVSAASSATATAAATFTLSDDQSQLSYLVTFDGFNLEADASLRVNPDDVNKVHLHLAPAGSTGPHVLNIFGLPSEDDDDLTVNYTTNSLSGVWDDSDAIDAATNLLFDPALAGSTKLLSDFVDELNAGDLYLAVHTAGQGGEVAIRGQITVVPEPDASLILSTLVLLTIVSQRSRRSVGL